MSFDISQQPTSSTTIAIANPSNNDFDEQAKAELLVIIHNYLASDPKYGDIATRLKDCIDTNQILPFRYDIYGQRHPETLASFIEKFLPFASSLPGMFERLCQLQKNVSVPPIHGLPIRFFSSRRTALDRNPNEKQIMSVKMQSVISNRPSPTAIQSLHPIRYLQTRELGRTMPPNLKHMFRKEYMTTFSRHTRILGHLSPIFCIAFDRTGRYIFTGADDNLVKVWDAQHCLLRFSFRGHTGEISDMSVSHENSLLASASLDKTVRIWCLRKGGTVHVYNHSATVNSVAFIPYFTPNNEWRWIVSAGNDCHVIFNRYNERTREFISPPIKYTEKATGGARLISSSISPGGNIVLMGDTHQAVILYRVYEQHVERITELEAHSDRVDTLLWAHKSLRFLSGSKDGTAKAWSIQSGQWKSVELVVPEEETSAKERRIQNANPQAKKNNNNVYKITMLSWSLEDDLVISIGSDYLLRTWDWRTGQMLNRFAGHQNETYNLVAHPLHKELLLSAGHDGLIILWNIYDGRQLCKHRNEDTNRDAVPIFDMTISADGCTIGCVDNIGNLIIYGVASNQKAMNLPHEQFFSTDYRLLQTNPDGQVVDEDTGLSPELLTPPCFVTSEGNMHPDWVQRLVPGNDIKSDDVIKPCAWLKRDIIEPMRPSIIERYKERQIEHSREEAIEYYAAVSKFVSFAEEVNIAPATKKLHVKKKNTRSAAASSITHHTVNVWQNQPRYVLDEDYTDEDDHSFSLGSEYDGEGHNVNMNVIDEEESLMEGEMLNNEAGRVDEDRNDSDNEVDDENDSDYELGGVERDTVFRERSSWTVTGRRKPRRRPRTASEEHDQQGSSSQDRPSEPQFRSERLRNRAVATRQHGREELQKPMSSRMAQQQHRTIKTRRTIISSEEDDQAAIHQEEIMQQRRRKIKAKSKKIMIEAEEQDDLGEVSENAENGRKNRSSHKRRIKEEPKSEASHNRASSSSSRNFHIGYPDWMRMVDRRRFPYFPQLGDFVVYFQQGHKAYLDELAKAGIHVPSKFKIQSYLDAEEVCYIDAIDYETIGKSPQIHVARLKLSRTKNNKRIGQSFQICHHDMLNVIDFVILKQHYDASLEMKLMPGDRIESIIDDEFYTGMVIDRNAYEAEYPKSEWSSVNLQWDNGEYDRFSPWDLQKWTRNRKSEMPAKPEDHAKLGEYTPTMEEWPVPPERCESASSASQLYQDRLLTAINQLTQLEDVEPFREAVDLRLYKNYIGCVNYPMDLRMIEERILNGFYRRSISILHDIQFLAKNAKAFNDPVAGAHIIRSACLLVETMFIFMENWEEEDAVDLYNRLDYFGGPLDRWRIKIHPAENAVNSSMAQSEPDNEQSISRRTRRNIGSKESDKDITGQSKVPLWATECREMVEQLNHTFITSRSNNRDMSNLAYTFLENLRTISEKLLGQCKTPERFIEGLHQFLTNQKHNVVETESRRSKIYHAILAMESQLDSKRQPILAKYRKMMTAQQEEREAQSNRRQKRAAAMSAQNLWRNTEESLDDDDDHGNARRKSSRVINPNQNQETLPITTRPRKRNYHCSPTNDNLSSRMISRNSTSERASKKQKEEQYVSEEDEDDESPQISDSEDSDYTEQKGGLKKVKQEEELDWLPTKTQSGRVVRLRTFH